MQAPHRSLEPRDGRQRFLIDLFDSLWERYRARVEPARRYEALVERHGGVFRNDHIAFRTFAWQEPAMGIFAVARPLEALGYRAAGSYDFPDKKLSSLHFRHDNQLFPKLFISELRCWELSDAARAIIARSLFARRQPLRLDELAELPAERLADRGALLRRCLSCFSRPWPAPERGDVEALDRETQFGAWVLVHGHEVNHFTASVDSHGVPALDDIEKTVAAMRAAGIAMKAEIEGAPGTPLRQSSTEAAVIPVDVEERGRPSTMPWTYAYFEIAERPLRVDPATGARDRFEGFLGPQATNLFDMTKFGASRAK